MTASFSKALLAGCALACASLLALADEPLSPAQLAEQLAASDVNTRREAAYQLARIGPRAKEALPALIKALDDAARGGAFTWDALWDAGFSDYYPFLRIGPDAIDSSSHYLAFYLNWAYAETGGCGQHGGRGGEQMAAVHASSIGRRGEASQLPGTSCRR